MVSTLVLGLVLLLLAPRLDSASVRALRDRPGATIGFGLLVAVLLPIIAVLLFVTIVGIPLGLFLLLALALVYSIGYVVGVLALGRLGVKENTSRLGWRAFQHALGLDTSSVPLFGSVGHAGKAPSDLSGPGRGPHPQPFTEPPGPNGLSAGVRTDSV